MGRPVEGGSAKPVHITGSDEALGGDLSFNGGDVTPANPLPVTLATGLNSTDDSVTAVLDEDAMAALVSHTVIVSGTFTRSNDTNSYIAGDIVTNSTSASTPISIASAARVSGGGGTVLPGGRLVQGSTVAAASGYRLWLYLSTPASIPNDNAAFTIAAANNAARLGFIDFIAQKTGSDMIEFYATEKLVPFKLASGTTLLGLLETLGAITTPTAQTVYTVYLPIAQD